MRRTDPKAIAQVREAADNDEVNIPISDIRLALYELNASCQVPPDPEEVDMLIKKASEMECSFLEKLTVFIAQKRVTPGRLETFIVNESVSASAKEGRVR